MPEASDDSASNASSMDRILARLKVARIEHEELVADDDLGRRVAIQMPNGQLKRRIVRSEWSILDFEQSNFESVTYLGDLDAVLDRSTGTIEAYVRSLDASSVQRLKQLFSKSENGEDDEDTDDAESIEALDEDSGEHASLAHPPETMLSAEDGSTNIRIGLALPTKTALGCLRVLGSKIVFRVTGVKSERHDDALDLLQKLSNSYFFSLHLQFGLALAIRKTPKRMMLRRLRRTVPLDADPQEFPKHEYDPDPMSLYWYANSTSGMPLLEFLALYQVLEYYFPAYSKKEAGRQIRAIIKDPSFRAEKERDISRILTAISSSNRGAIGNERQQLKATLTECVIESELTSFLLEYDERKDFFSKLHKQLTNQKILSGNPMTTNISAVADAIYDIRCKIVHSKADDSDLESKRLLPFSEELELLEEYIFLMRFLAQKALIYSSTRLVV